MKERIGKSAILDFHLAELGVEQNGEGNLIVKRIEMYVKVDVYLILVFVSCACRATLFCGEGEYIIHVNRTLYCVDCLDCLDWPPGLYPKFDCVGVVIYNASTDSEWDFCQTGYYKVSRGYDACLECKKCQNGLYLKKCEVDQNSVCNFKTMEFIMKDDHTVMTADAYIDKRSMRQFIIVISVCLIITCTFVLYVFSDFFKKLKAVIVKIL